MCRLLCYLGVPISIDELLAKPENSLILQSRDASYHPGCDAKRNIRVNGDGFGLAWYYADRLSEGSCMVKFATPAWSCPNLLNLAKFVRTPLLFAHVRAASDGNQLLGGISYENCHPFKHNRYTFMHNGGIPGFPCMKREIMASLSDSSFRVIEGATDSEVVFAIFLDVVGDLSIQLTSEELSMAVQDTVTRVLELVEEASEGFDGPCPAPISLNLCVTDGRHIVATRYRNHPIQSPPSLYFLMGSEFTSDSRGCLRQVAPDPARSIVISSEPLSKHHAWSLVPRNHMVVASTRAEDSTWVESVRVLPMFCHPSELQSGARRMSTASVDMSSFNPYLCSPKFSRRDSANSNGSSVGGASELSSFSGLSLTLPLPACTDDCGAGLPIKKHRPPKSPSRRGSSITPTSPSHCSPNHCCFEKRASPVVDDIVVDPTQCAG